MVHEGSTSSSPQVLNQNLLERGEDEICVGEHEGGGDERESRERSFEQQPSGHGEERSEAGAEQGRMLAKVQKAARGGEQGQKDEVAHAEAKAQSRAKDREDE
jgi:hypothetical protein